jgi:hypothetical protein
MKNKNLFLVVLETSKSKNEGPTASEEGLLAASSHSVREPKREREKFILLSCCQEPIPTITIPLL